MAKRGKATVALVTSDFWPQGDFIASAVGMPDLPRQQVPHPVAGSGDAAMSKLAFEIAPQLVATLRGES